MGRRKIEIRPIKDDRNRSVTFLKRKGGLFKKAYELGVLCSVDVAVIIFGHNKKLYEFSSGDINETLARRQYYGLPHEQKGPADFAGKGGGDEDEEDEEIVDDAPPGSRSPTEATMMAHNLHSQPGLQHMRQHTPAGSPPIPNGAMPHMYRNHTPQPQNISRPSSRATHLRRTSSNLAIPQHHPPSQAPSPQPNYAYTPNPPFYNPQATAGVQRATPPQPHPQQYHYPTHPPPTQQQIQAAYMQDQRRSSMPPTYQQQMGQPQQPPPTQMRTHTPQSHAQDQRRPSPQPPHATFQSPPLPQPKPLPAHAKSHSIFTPIDDSRSLLAQHWGSTSNSEPQPSIKSEGPRSQSIDVAAMNRNQNGASPRPPPPPQQPQRTASSSSIPSLNPGSRANTFQSDAKRPRLKVQIPSEQSDGGSATAESTSPKDTSLHTGTGPGIKPLPAPQHGVVLPPPSPSTNALLSAGASGPPNPFARPAPPVSTNPHATNRDRDHIETPLSALPSRFMDGNQMLPSPSSLWSDAWFNRNSDNMMPSPLNFQQTPVAWHAPTSFKEEDRDLKRRAEEEDGNGIKRARN